MQLFHTLEYLGVYHYIMEDKYKGLEQKLKKDEKKLNELKNEKFKRNASISERERKKFQCKEEWKLTKELINVYIKKCKLISNKISMNALGKFLNVDPKTAKKYYLLVINSKDLKYLISTKPKWNEVQGLRELIINKIYEVIIRTDVHMGERVPLALTDLIDDVEEDLNLDKPLKYQTIHSWIRNDYRFITKYSTKKRARILNQIKVISERIERNKLQIAALRKVRSAKIRAAIVNETENIIKTTQIKKIKKTEHIIPGQIVEWDGAQDIIYHGKRINRIQAVDISGYSYATIFSAQETNKPYKQALHAILKQTRCYVILADKRKGVDPSDAGAEVAAIARNLNITIIASSDSNIKPLVEKDHGLVRSKTSIYFGKHDIRILKQAILHSKKINERFNKKYGYKQPDYNGKRVSAEILDFILWDHKVIKPYSDRFIKFKKEAYELIKNGKCISLDTSDVYVVGKHGSEIKILFKNVLYQTKKIPKINFTSKEFASTLVRDKFRKNDIVVITPESMKFWIESETKALSFHVERKIRKQYQEKMTYLFEENTRLKKKLPK